MFGNIHFILPCGLGMPNSLRVLNQELCAGALSYQAPPEKKRDSELRENLSRKRRIKHVPSESCLSSNTTCSTNRPQGTNTTSWQLAGAASLDDGNAVVFVGEATTIAPNGEMYSYVNTVKLDSDGNELWVWEVRFS